MRVAKISTEPRVLKASELAQGVPSLVGVELTVRPIEPAMYLVAREAARRVYADLTPDLSYTAPSDDGTPSEPVRAEDVRALDVARYKSTQAFTLEFARLAIIDWKGVEDGDGNPLPLTDAGIAQAFSVIELYDFFDLHCVNPVRMVETEKNASSPSQNGTSGAKIPAKATVATAPRHARIAPTPSTPRKRVTVKSPGRP